MPPQPFTAAEEELCAAIGFNTRQPDAQEKLSVCVTTAAKFWENNAAIDATIKYVRAMSKAIRENPESLNIGHKQTPKERLRIIKACQYASTSYGRKDIKLALTAFLLGSQFAFERYGKNAQPKGLIVPIFNITQPAFYAFPVDFYKEYIPSIHALLTEREKKQADHIIISGIFFLGVPITAELWGKEKALTDAIKGGFEESYHAYQHKTPELTRRLMQDMQTRFPTDWLARLQKAVATASFEASKTYHEENSIEIDVRKICDELHGEFEARARSISLEIK